MSVSEPPRNGKNPPCTSFAASAFQKVCVKIFNLRNEVVTMSVIQHPPPQP